MSHEEKCHKPAVLCLSCRHINLEPKVDGEYTCKAFPLGIPAEICAGDFDHHDPHPEDNGIRYTQKCYSLSSFCLSCKHFNLDPKDDGEYICKAFPLGIPTEICFGDFDHRNPHPEDNGIQYERNPRLRDDDFPTMKYFDEWFERRRREREDFE
jgi:hypothetical protein